MPKHNDRDNQAGKSKQERQTINTNQANQNRRLKVWKSSQKASDARDGRGTR